MFSVRGPKLKYFAAILAVICLFGGVYLTFFQSRGFEKTSATIVDLEADQTGEDVTYYPIVDYTVDGVSYTGRVDQGNGSYSVGDTITIYYNPENPEIIHGGKGIGIYFMIASVVILAIVIVSSVREHRGLKETKETIRESGNTKYAPHIEGEERELYFLTDLGTLKAGHRIEDANRKVLYEAKMTELTVFGAYKFDFIDHEHGTTIPHMVGHAEETQWGSILLDDHLTFEFDGADVWKHLKENGISVDTSYTAGESTLVGMKYHIFRDGAEVAVAETTSQYPHEDDAAEHKVASAVPVEGFFRIWTKEQNLDLLFLTIMAFARSKSSDDKGGTIGAKIGTIKKLTK